MNYPTAFSIWRFVRFKARRKDCHIAREIFYGEIEHCDRRRFRTDFMPPLINCISCDLYSPPGPRKGKLFVGSQCLVHIHWGAVG